MGYTKYTEDIKRDHIELYGETNDMDIPSTAKMHKESYGCPECGEFFFEKAQFIEHLKICYPEFIFDKVFFYSTGK